MVSFFLLCYYCWMVMLPYIVNNDWKTEVK